MGLWHAFREGGWVMFLVFAFGLIGVGTAGRFAWRGEHQLLGFIRWMAVTLFGSGWFGFFVGWQKVLGAVASVPAPSDSASMAQRAYILVVGTREALTCVSGSLMFFVIICLLAAVGLRRFPWPNPGSALRADG